LHQELHNTALPSRPVAARTREANASLTFFEAYFSNFIEGTEFDVAEAADIVFNNVIPADRPEDAHDVLAHGGSFPIPLIWREHRKRRCGP
jgi:hypothetical protein